jgi:hypothetical protein
MNNRALKIKSTVSSPGITVHNLKINNMKKIFTLFAGLLLTAVVFAADRKPVVTINNNSNFKIVVDGKSYFGDDLTLRLSDNFRNVHTIKVYTMKRSIFAKQEKLVDAAAFQLNRNSVAINIDRMGNIKIREAKDSGSFGNKDKYGYKDRDSKSLSKKDGHDRHDSHEKRF